MIAIVVIAVVIVVLAASASIDDTPLEGVEPVSRRCLDRLNDNEPHQ